ncbi:hypothetical protein MTO98_26530 [Mucilaginibacter sp. SMC90]|uniref:hypothetical protein n=1 Tax=Mucilaginibacter sp. SMC90 TaxID=2929803 RepID=UPI001FB4BA9B|nr:hypothetical protein [Mucilaginibacter sp. SMC90]UOE47971.1 hypothetical protein MTO98_26530 [Mucilaginibacter sp. SMC90]
MAQTVDYWYNQIITKVYGDDVLSDLDHTSAVADYKLWAYIVAYVAWTIDVLFDLRDANVQDILATKKPHTEKWYRDLSLRFQYGQALIPDTDQYLNTGLDASQIAAQKIITQAAVKENDDGSMRIKVVKLLNDDYAQLSDAEILAFKAYIADTKDAGVRINIDSLPPDSLKLVIDIFYDPLVLDNTGARIDGNATAPVIDAIKAYLKALKFNGEFAKTRLADQLQTVDGVVLVGILSAQSQYGTRPFTEIDERVIPDAGYLRVIDDGFTINYRAYA